MKAASVSSKSFLILAFSLLVVPSAISATADLDAATAYLAAQQQESGAIWSEPDIANAEQSTQETLLALSLRGESGLIDVLKASAYLQQQENVPTEYLARAITVTTANSASLDELLLRQNRDGGFGAFAGQDSQVWETAFAIRALVQSDITSSNLASALGWILNSQHADGYWRNASGAVDVPATALALGSLWDVRMQFDVAAAIQRASSWLLNHRAADALWQNDETSALVLAELARTEYDNPEMSRSLQAMEAKQAPDGSWGSGVYETALILKALYFSSNTVPVPTVGGVTGKFLDAETNAPLAGVEISITGPANAAALTDAGGRIHFDNLPAGEYSLTASLAGYAGVTLSGLRVKAGATNDLGSTAMQPQRTGSSLSGVISDASSNESLPGVVVTLIGAETVTLQSGSDGSFAFAGLAAGDYSLSFALEGYETVALQLTLPESTHYTISPAMYPLGEQPVDASLEGTVLDRDTGTPIAGASINVAEHTALTGDDGSFAITGLTAGSISANIEAPGYTGANLSGVIAPGVNNIGNIYLAPLSDTVSIAGVVTDAADGSPLAGAIVSISGANGVLTTDIDGRFSVDGIQPGSIDVLVEAAGYLSASQSLDAASVRNFQLDIRLQKNAGSPVEIEAVHTNKTVYDPFDEVEIEAEVANLSLSEQAVLLYARVTDSQGKTLKNIPAVELVAGQTPADALITLAAGAEHEQDFVFYARSTPAGTYTITVQVADSSGRVLAERATVFEILGKPVLAGGLELSPPLVQAGTNVPVAITAQVYNRGNEPLPAGPASLQVILSQPDPDAPSEEPGKLISLPMSVANSRPVSISRGEDGVLYVLGQTSRAVYRYREDGESEVVVQLPQRLNNISVSPIAMLRYADGSYVILNRDYFLITVSAEGDIASIPTGFDSHIALTGGEDRTLFVAGKNGNNRRVIKIATDGTVLTIAENGISGPAGMDIDATGGIYVANSGDGTIGYIDVTGNARIFAGGFVKPVAVLSEPGGAVLVLDRSAATLTRMHVDGAREIIAANLPDPLDMARDGAGTLFVLSGSNQAVYAVAEDGATSLAVQGFVNSPQGVAFDSQGRIYATSAQDGTLRRLEQDGSVTTLVTSMNSPRDVEVTTDGRAYVASYYSGKLYEVDGENIITKASGLTRPYGVAIDDAGVLYVTENYAGNLVSIAPDGSRNTLVRRMVYWPVDISAMPDGRVLIVNNGFATVFDPVSWQGETFNTSNAYSADVGADGSIYLRRNYNLLIRKPDGTIVTRYLPYGGRGVIANNDGSVVVAGSSGNKLLKLERDSSTLTTLTSLPGYPVDIAGDKQGTVYVLLNNQEVYRFDVSGLTKLAKLPVYISSIEWTPDGVLAVAESYQKIYRVKDDGSVTLEQETDKRYRAVAQMPDGSISGVSVNENIAMLDVTDESSVVYGFSLLTDVELAHGKLYLAETNGKIFEVAQNGRLTLLQIQPATYLAEAPEGLYAASGNSVYQITASAKQKLWSETGESNVSLAAHPQYGFALGLNTRNLTRQYDASWQLKGQYAGFHNASALAARGQGELFIANKSASSLLKADAKTRFSEPVISMSSPAGVSFGDDGMLYVVGSNQTAKYDVDSRRLLDYWSSNYDYVDVVASGGKAYISDSVSHAIRIEQNNEWLAYAAGLPDVTDLALASDGGLYSTGFNSGSIVQVSEGSSRVHASNLYRPTSLSFDAQGQAFTGSENGMISRVDTDGVLTQWPTAELLNRKRIFDIMSSSDGIYLAVSDENSAYRYIEPDTRTIPEPGTVVAEYTLDLPALPVDGQPVQIPVADWLPELGGEYLLKLESTMGVDGVALNNLHAGSHALGRLLVNTDEVAPGDQPVHLGVLVEGADFTRLAKVDTDRLALAVANGAHPQAMGADRNGFIYFSGSYGGVKRVSPGGEVTTFSNVVNAARGEIPVDDDQNIYIAKNGNPRQVLRISQAGVEEVLAEFSSVIDSITRLDNGRLFALTGSNTVYEILATGEKRVVYSGLSSAYSITHDGAGNLYVLSKTYVLLPPGNYGNPIFRITPDGEATVLRQDALFEFEGVTIAGDCADNLFLAPIQWSEVGQAGEEHTLAQIVGRTGQAGAIFDGRTINSDLADMDFIVYDRFASDMLIWTDYSGGRIYRLPVTCGAIDVDAHVVLAPGQTAGDFSVAPSAVVERPDGATEYLWQLKDVTAQGSNIAFDAMLPGLALGEQRAVAQEAYLVFKNSYLQDDIRLPLDVPSVRVDDLVDIAVTTDKPVYGEREAVDIPVLLTNRNPELAAGQLHAQIHTPEGELVAEIASELTEVPAESTAPASFDWNTGDIMAGEYRVYVAFENADGRVMAESEAPFQVVAAHGGASLSAALSVDKAEYVSGETAMISSRVSNLANNALLENLTVHEAVTGPDGETLFSEVRDILQLAPAGNREFLFAVALATAPPGEYLVRQTVTDAAGIVLDEQTRGFTVLSSADTGAGLSGMLNAAPVEQPQGLPVNLDALVRNQGNAALAALPVHLRIIDPLAEAVTFESSQQINLAINQEAPLNAVWNTVEAAPGAYVALLVADIGGGSQLLAQQTLRITPPILAAEGSLSVPPEADVGDSVLVDATVHNQSSIPLHQLALTFSAEGPQGAASSWTSSIDLARDGTQQLLQSWNTADLPEGEYTLRMYVDLGGTQTLLAEQSIVLRVPIKMSLMLGEGHRGRVLVLLDGACQPQAVNNGKQTACQADPFGPDNVPDTAIQREHLEAVLDAAGWAYTVTETAETFQAEFASGGYEAYLLLSEQVKLPEQLQSQLVADIHAGRGLVLAGNHDRRNGRLEEALGIQSLGKNLDAASIVLDASRVHEGGEIPFETAAAPNAIRSQGAQIIGRYRLNDTRGQQDQAALTWQVYGNGRAVYAGFDLLMQSAAAGDDGEFAALISQALDAVQPEPLVPEQGRVFPLVVTLDNTGVATPGRILFTAAPGSSLVAASMDVIHDGNTLSWEFDAAQGQHFEWTLWLRLDAAGMAEFKAIAQSRKGVEYTDRALDSQVLLVEPQQ